MNRVFWQRKLHLPLVLLVLNALAVPAFAVLSNTATVLQVSSSCEIALTAPRVLSEKVIGKLTRIHLRNGVQIVARITAFSEQRQISPFVRVNSPQAGWFIESVTETGDLSLAPIALGQIQKIEVIDRVNVRQSALPPPPGPSRRTLTETDDIEKENEETRFFNQIHIQDNLMPIVRELPAAHALELIAEALAVDYYFNLGADTYSTSAQEAVRRAPMRMHNSKIVAFGSVVAVHPLHMLSAWEAFTDRLDSLVEEARSELIANANNPDFTRVYALAAWAKTMITVMQPLYDCNTSFGRQTFLWVLERVSSRSGFTVPVPDLSKNEVRNAVTTFRVGSREYTTRPFDSEFKQDYLHETYLRGLSRFAAKNKVPYFYRIDPTDPTIYATDDGRPFARIVTDEIFVQMMHETERFYLLREWRTSRDYVITLIEGTTLDRIWQSVAARAEAQLIESLVTH